MAYIIQTYYTTYTYQIKYNTKLGHVTIDYRYKNIINTLS